MDSQQQFCLKWNSFGSNLATAFSNLFKSDSLADVTLFCEGQKFKAHRLILAACSKHFQELFDAAPPSHAGACYVILEATTAANMSALLEFMYKGEVHVSQDALSSFLKSAESLQVKGLSIEHEKLAVAQSQQHVGDRHGQKVKVGGHGAAAAGGGEGEAPPPPAASFAPILAPFAHHPLYGAAAGRYAPPAHLPPHGAAPRRPPPPDHRGSVLSKAPKHEPSTAPSPHARNYRPGSSSSLCSVPADEPDTRSSPGGGRPYDDAPEQRDAPATPTTTTHAGNNAYERSASAADDPVCERRLSVDQGAEDLRVKLETEYHPGAYSAPPTPTAPLLNTNFPDKPPEASPTPPNPIAETNIWTAKLASNKSGGIATADGKKLKCPFCERLYGYETNLRAHIRQRHQGIRVPCPYCSRTFTRNNTVRRHIAREHKHDAAANLKLTHSGPLHNHAQ